MIVTTAAVVEGKPVRQDPGIFTGEVIVAAPAADGQRQRARRGHLIGPIAPRCVLG